MKLFSEYATRPKIRQSLKYVSWKEHKEIAADLKNIYGANTLDEAEIALVSFAEKWDAKYPNISQVLGLAIMSFFIP